MTKIPLEIIRLQPDGFHILVEIKLLQKTFKMVVDTGASKTVLDKETLLASGIDAAALQGTNVLSTGLGTNNMQSFFVHIPEANISDWYIKNFDFAVLDLSSINAAYRQMRLQPVVGVLGGDILHTYGAVIDYRKATLQLNNRKRVISIPKKDKKTKVAIRPSAAQSE
ncbi:retroviral-like aspartic protease family protein [Sphingobacterium sp. lm-10]|uniref:retropepsin-like aspartic protease n=1 Tax=Sphingobacterium sp. lm-10 TaxID=2944904 RepID=UPI0020210F2A|nr:retropepsin-like aspartic protease [Sphingobacterium sp. lm-10]MCL7987857.1 retroviral-like aspartic protease family protein [Sphingobacterium sp. lm-10]